MTVAADQEERVVVLAPTGRDGPLTLSILERAGFRAVLAGDVASLCALATEGCAAVLVAEEVLVPAAAARLAALLTAQEPWSDLPVLVFTGAGGTIQARRPTIETLAPFGNVTLIDRPVQIMTLVSAVRAALRARRRQYTARALLTSLDASVKSRDQFLAILGHELRNPLSAISVANELLDRAHDPARARGIIRRQSAKLARLVEDLLDVSRVTSGKIVLKRSRLDLREVVARAVEGLDAAAERAGLRLELHLADAPVPVEGDAVRLDQIVANLVANAVKYTPRGGEIAIAVGEEGGRAVLRVRDDGIGLAADMLERVFEPFAQADAAIDRAQGGLGLGLALVRGLVTLHGGAVRAESAGIGRGAEFVVELPAAAPLPPPAPDAKASGVAARRRRVLVVEDNDDNRTGVVLLLERLGHSAVAAADGPAAVSAARASRPDAAVVDIGLPGFDGYEVARRLRAELGTAVLLVALTGYGLPEDKERAYAAGFDLHLTKPADAEALSAALAGPARPDH